MRRPRRLAVALALLALATAATAVQVQAAAAPTVQDWPQYLHDATHSGATQDNAITQANATALKARPGWPVRLGPAISSQPIVANGLIYAGSYDGSEYAVTAAGVIRWKRPLGTTTSANSSCHGTTGVASTATIARVTIGADTSPSQVLYVGAGGSDTTGGGSAVLAALDATTGVVRWKATLGPAPATFIWSSPLVLTPPGASTPSVYIGVSSYDDCPLVQGRLVQLDARTGAVQHQFAVMPTGCSGGSIWGSPTYDPADGSLYAVTGNPGGSCAAAGHHPDAILKLRASDLTLLGSWEVPAAEAPGDSDFGSTPTLFRGTVTPGGAARALVGAGNKNGIFYVWDRAHVANGPVARLRIAIGGDCPQCGQGVIAPAAYDGSTVYVGGGMATSGSTYKGVLSALDPNNLSRPRWQHNTGQPILGAVTVVPGLVVVAEGTYILLVNPTTGSTVARYYWGMGMLDGAPSVASGVLYQGDMHGSLWAYSVNGA